MSDHPKSGFATQALTDADALKRAMGGSLSDDTAQHSALGAIIEAKRDLERLTSFGAGISKAVADAHAQLAKANLVTPVSRLRSFEDTSKLSDPAPAPAPNPVTSPEALGQRVRQAREALGMTQAAFADAAGVGRRFVSELENGKATLELGKVMAVCAAAGLDLLVRSR
jgi:y4mF family transcriptional regulator